MTTPTLEDVLDEIITMADEQIKALKALDEKYPEEYRKEKIKARLELQLTEMDKLIEKKRTEYRMLKSYKEKQEYFEKKLSTYELGYKTATANVKKALGDLKVKPHSAWIGPHQLELISEFGYDDALNFYTDNARTYVA